MKNVAKEYFFIQKEMSPEEKIIAKAGEIGHHRWSALLHQLCLSCKGSKTSLAKERYGLIKPVSGSLQCFR